ncbi:MAG: hypothetical protein V3V13_12395 [Paracoccaceae bacterium]
MYLRAFTDVYDGIRGLLFPQRYEFGFTADMDNADFPPALLDGFRAMFATDVSWRKPSATQRRRFMAMRDHLGADNLIAVSVVERQEFWVMDNDWAGFPDPAQFLFVGFARNKSIVAAGRFEDWPDNWQREETKG